MADLKIATLQEAIELTGRPIASTIPNKCCTFGEAMDFELEIAHMTGITGNQNQLVPLAALSKPSSSISVKFAFGKFNGLRGSFYIRIGSSGRHELNGAANTHRNGIYELTFDESDNMISGSYDPAGYNDLKGMKINGIICGKYPVYGTCGYAYAGNTYNVEFIE